MGKDHADNRPAPLLILCPPRSFSSVVCAILGRHPELYDFPELNLFLADTLGDILDGPRLLGANPNRAPGTPVFPYDVGLTRAVAELHFGSQTPDTLAEARGRLNERRDWSSQRVFDSLLDKIRPRTGVDKSPLNVLSPEFMERARAMYPHARFLHLTRHPVSAMRSMHEFFGKRGFGPVGEDNCRAGWNGYARAWCSAHQAVLNFTATLPAGQVLRMRGEDLLREPDVHLPRVAAWLGIRCDTGAIEAMKHPENSPFASAGPLQGWAGYDPKFLERPQLRLVEKPGRLDVPRAWQLDPWLTVTTLELGKRLGYGSPRECPC
jgi:hypothetical protein